MRNGKNVPIHEGVWRSENTALHIINIDTGWGCTVSPIPWVLTAKESVSVTKGIGDWVSQTLWRRNESFASTESQNVIHTGCKKKIGYAVHYLLLPFQFCWFLSHEYILMMRVLSNYLIRNYKPSDHILRIAVNFLLSDFSIPLFVVYQGLLSNICHNWKLNHTNFTI